MSEDISFAHPHLHVGPAGDFQEAAAALAEEYSPSDMAIHSDCQQ